MDFTPSTKIYFFFLLSCIGDSTVGHPKAVPESWKRLLKKQKKKGQPCKSAHCTAAYSTLWPRLPMYKISYTPFKTEPKTRDHCRVKHGLAVSVKGSEKTNMGWIIKQFNRGSEQGWTREQATRVRCKGGRIPGWSSVWKPGTDTEI